MWKYSEAHLLCNRFEFEVPLEDLYPPNYLHPRIEILYEQALKLFQENNVSLDVLLSSENGNSQDRIDLKDNLWMNKRPKLQGTPGSFLWLIEHFLGLLPIPLLASYMNGYNFKWLNLSQECKAIFHEVNIRKRLMNFEHCDHCIHNEISKLPSQHRLLLNEHIEFMRNISFIGRKRKKSVAYYSEYFTASLLLRPFRSGLNETNETDYYPLIKYIVLRWPHIRKILIESSLTTISEIIDDGSSVQIPNLERSKIKPKPKIFCSSFQSLHDSDSKNKLDSISSKSQVSMNSKEVPIACVNKVGTERIVPSRTRSVVTAQKSNISIAEYRSKQNEEKTSIQKEIDSQQLLKKDNTVIEINDTQNEEREHEENPSIQKEIDSQQLLKKNNRDIEINDTELNLKENCKELENTDKKPTESKSQSEQINSENITIDSKIMKRVSQLGWTYTPPKISGPKSKESSSITNISDDDSTRQDLMKDSQSETTIKKYPSVKSLKSRLSFLKIGNKHKKNKTLLKTNFKYTKMDA